MAKKQFIPNKLRPWIDARRKYKLSHSHIQMARELGLNPKKFGSLSNTNQQRWKIPLPEYIEEIYFKHFKKKQPDNIRSIEQAVIEKSKNKAESKARKQMANSAIDPTPT